MIWLYLKRCRKKVYETSIPFKLIEQLNKGYSFYSVEQYYESYEDDIFVDIMNNRRWYIDIIRMCRYNSELVKDYSARLSRLKLVSEKSEVSEVHIPFSLYRHYELEIVNSAIYAPVCCLTIKCGDRLYSQSEIEELLAGTVIKKVI